VRRDAVAECQPTLTQGNLPLWREQGNRGRDGSAEFLAGLASPASSTRRGGGGGGKGKNGE
jgi:hypothetical protein